MHMLGNIYLKKYIYTFICILYLLNNNYILYIFNKFQLIKTSGGYVSVLLANQGS